MNRSAMQEASSIEDQYVTNVYSRLASYTKASKPSPARLAPVVSRFIRTLPPGAVVVDIGCGENKYDIEGGFLLGVDPCAEILVKMPRGPNSDVFLADAMQLPFRNECADGVLFVSVLHHFTTPARRRKALEEMARVLAPDARGLIVVWAHEQPNASFPGQDVLVPWNMHEIPLNGRLPRIRFHKDSTKEQRVIQASIPITVSSEEKNGPTGWLKWLSSQVTRLRPPPTVPPPVPSFLPPNKRAAIFSGIRRWSPQLARRIASLVTTVEEQLADEISRQVMDEAITEALACIRNVTFYRYYHVFKESELEFLVSSVSSLKLVSTTFENGNWNVIVQKRAAGRPNI